MLVLWSPKGGSGTSVVAAACAVVIARSEPVRLWDRDGDQRAYFGLPDTDPAGGATWGGAEVAPGIELVTGDIGAGGGDDRVTVVDAGLASDETTRELIASARPVLMVTRACYVALRRAVRHPSLARTDGVVVVQEPGRALTPRDVAEVLGRPVVARIPASESIARAADAGVLARRCPEPLWRPVRRALVACDVIPPRRAA